MGPHNALITQTGDRLQQDRRARTVRLFRSVREFRRRTNMRCSSSLKTRCRRLL
jgi:hypothetical protein